MPPKNKFEFVGDTDYLAELLKILTKAKKEINIMEYSFAIGSESGKLATYGAPYEIAEKLVAIKQKLKSKIRIRLYLEGTRDTSSRNKVTAKFLKAEGIEIKFGATHAKGFSVDGKYTLFGSTNLTHQSITKNLEANILIDDLKLTKVFNQYFEHLWQGGKHGEIQLAEPFFADSDFKDELISVIDQAKKHIGFSIYFFNHKEIDEALIRAHNRGVKISGFIHQHGSFGLSYIYANRRTIKKMKEAGIEDLHFSEYRTFFHSKYLVADKKDIMMGTGNWLVEDVLTHPQLYLHLRDSKLALKFLKHLKAQILKDSFSP